MLPSLRGVSLACLALVPLAIGCSGGSGASDQGSMLTLAITPTTHAELMEYQASLDSVELLDDQGRSTGNLLARGVRVPVVSENPESAWLALRSPAEGRYTELRIRYASGVQNARHRSGDRVGVVVDGLEQRMPIGESGLHHRKGSSWLELRHRSDANAAQDTVSRWRWWPRQKSDVAEGLFFHDSRVRVQSIVSATAFRFSGTFERVGAAGTVEFAVRPDAILIAEGVGRITRDELFARLVPGSVVKVLGRVGVDGAVQVRHLVLRHQVPDDDDVEVLAVLTFLDRQTLVATIDVQSVRQGQEQFDRHFGNARDRLIPISLQGAEIRRAGGGEVSINDLAVGQTVEVEFKDFPTPEPMRVKSITIEDGFAQLEGRVVDVTGLPQSFLAAPREDDCLFRRGALNNTVRVQLSPATRIFRDRESNVVGVEQVQLGTRVRVRGTRVDPGVVNATSVQLRLECGSGRRGGDD